MPTITYTGPDEISPSVATGPAQAMAFPKEKPIEVSEEIAALVRRHPRAGEFILAAPSAPALKKKQEA